MRLLRFTFKAFLGDPSAEGWTPPESLEWMVGGKQTVCLEGPDGKPTDVTTVTTEADAARLDAQLQQSLALAREGKASRPFIDFAHQGHEASAIPVRFFWDDGIRLAVEWTSRGLEALKGRIFSYFSPEFRMGPSGQVLLPEVGPIGGLVNTPAYQTIERLSAAMPENPVTQQQAHTMNTLIAKLVAAGVMPAPATELTEDQLVAALQSQHSAATTAAAKAAEEVATAKASLAAHIEESAKADVDAAIAARKIAPTSREHWIASYVANPKNARAMLGGIETAPPPSGHPNTALPGAGKLEEPRGLARTEASFKAQLGRRASAAN